MAERKNRKKQNNRPWIIKSLKHKQNHQTKDRKEKPKSGKENIQRDSCSLLDDTMKRTALITKALLARAKCSRKEKSESEQLKHKFSAADEHA